MQSADIVILRELYRNESLDIYVFHKLYSLSPAALAQTINRFLKLGVIEIQDDLIRLTDFGLKWILSNRKSLFLKDRVQEWKDVPDYMLKTKIPVDSLYVPRKSLVDKEFFMRLIESKG